MIKILDLYYSNESESHWLEYEQDGQSYGLEVTDETLIQYIIDSTQE